MHGMYVVLFRLNEGGVPCPSVVMLKKHVLIMEFIGKDGRPAPKLSDLSFTDDILKKAYEQCIEVSVVCEQCIEVSVVCEQCIEVSVVC